MEMHCSLQQPEFTAIYLESLWAIYCITGSYSRETGEGEGNNQVHHQMQQNPTHWPFYVTRLLIESSQSAHGLKIRLESTCFFVFFRLQPKPIRVSSKTGIPLDVLPARGLTAKQAERMTKINDSDLPRVSTQPRSKDESKEERKARKQAIKEERKVRDI